MSGFSSKAYRIVAFFFLAVTISACTSPPILGGTSWKEEVLLHDGSTIIAKRSQTYGGRHEIGQTAPIASQTIVFTVPESNRSIRWKSEYSEDIGRSNFRAVALHILQATPYVLAVPNLCLAYNKWGRPNPPYVVFRHDGMQWQRMSMVELPTEFKNINLVVATKADEKIITGQPFVSGKLVRQLNGSLDQPEYRSILRDPLSREKCPQISRGPKAPTPIEAGQPMR